MQQPNDLLLCLGEEMNESSNTEDEDEESDHHEDDRRNDGPSTKGQEKVAAESPKQDGFRVTKVIE